MEFNFIELPTFQKNIDELETSVDQWVYFIKNAENLTVIPQSVKDEGLKEAYTEANQQNWTKQELDDYQRASIKERDEIGRMEFAERKGRIEGKIEGKIEVVKQGRQMGLSNADLSELTGLTIEEIEKI